jgi:DNA-binding transcriptional MerR regulator
MSRKPRRKTGGGKGRGGKRSSDRGGVAGRISAAARGRRSAARNDGGTPPRDAPVSAPIDEDGAAPTDLSVLKSGKLYYRIGEVSQITGVKPYVLRYWESEFRLMAPQKSRSKQRLYRQKDIETILQIKRLLYEERYTIAGARRRLRELGAAAARTGAAPESGQRSQAVAPQPPRSELPEDEEVLRGIRDQLVEIRSLLAAEL